jgi:AsmA protein
LILERSVPMRFKMTASVSPSASEGTKVTVGEKVGKSLKMAVHTLQEFYRPLVEKLGSANLSKGMKRNLKIAGIVAAGLMVLLIVLPFLINVNSFRPKIESEVTNALGRPVTLGNLSLSILTGTVGVDNISIADDPTFSKSPFVTAKSLSVGVKLMPLIFSRELNVTEIVLDEPQISLLKATNGKWNFSSIGGANTGEPSKQEKSGTSTAQNFSVAKLEIKDGKLNVGKVNSTAKAQVYDSVNVEVKDFSFASQFPFELSMVLPGSGKVNVSGKAGPINTQDAANTPLNVAIKVENMNLAASGFIDQSTGVGGQVDFTGTLVSDGSQAKAAGALNCGKLKLSPKGSPARKSVTVKYMVNADLNKQTGTITQGDIAIGKATAKLTGGFQTQGETQVLNVKLSAPGMPVDELEAMLPALGVVLPSGSQLQGGTLSAELGVSGLIDKPVITGPVRLANTKLAGFDLGSKLGALSAFTGKAPPSRDTSIQNASLNARVAPEGTKADAINVTVPALGVITGAGTISPAGALDFRMLAELQGGVAGGLAQRTGRANANGIPFSIQGTTSDPKFVPDVGAIAGGAARGAIQNAVPGKTGAAGAAGGLLRKRRP